MMISLSYFSSKCYICGCVKSSNITFFNNSERKYVSCNNCYENIHNCIIPKEEYNYGIIIFYNYYEIEFNHLSDNVFKHIHLKSSNTKQKIMLSSVINHYIQIFDQKHLTNNIETLIQKLENNEITILIPIFFTTKRRHRNYPEIELYSLIELYQNNPNIGYYEVDFYKYNQINTKNYKYIYVLNNILFQLLLKYNYLCKSIMYIYYNDNTYLGLLPLDIIYNIIRLMKN